MTALYKLDQVVMLTLGAGFIGGVVFGILVYIYMREQLKHTNAQIRQLNKKYLELAEAKSSKLVKEKYSKLISVLEIIAGMNKKSENPDILLVSAINTAKQGLGLVKR